MFGDRASGAHLPKLAWTKIVRHQTVQHRASPDDPALTDYWARRRRRSRPPLDRSTLRLLQEQDGRCDLCGGYLLHADREPDSPQQWEQWLAATRKAITKHYVIAHAGTGTTHGYRLTHIHCHRRTTGGGEETGTSAHLNRPEGLA